MSATDEIKLRANYHRMMKAVLSSRDPRRQAWADQAGDKLRVPGPALQLRPVAAAPA